MSKNETVLNTAKQQITNFDLSKIFIWNNRYQKGNFLNNAGYDPYELKAGTVLGRIAASNILIPCHHLSTDGSQYPVGVLAHDVDVDAGDTVEVTICDGGDVAEEKLILYYGTTLESVVNSRTVRDWLQAQGLKVVGGTEMTDYDNQ